MIKRIHAIFDGNVFRPSEPCNLEPNTEVELTLNIPETNGESPSSFLDIAEGLKLEGPADWSSNVDQYLYGTADNPDG